MHVCNSGLYNVGEHKTVMTLKISTKLYLHARSPAVQYSINSLVRKGERGRRSYKMARPGTITKSASLIFKFPEPQPGGPEGAGRLWLSQLSVLLYYIKATKLEISIGTPNITSSRFVEGCVVAASQRLDSDGTYVELPGSKLTALGLVSQ